MTTAARPTFEPAKGGRGKGENDLSALSKQYSSRDMPAQLKLKTRQQGQDTQDEIMGRDLRKELELKEMNVKEKSERYNPNQDSGSAKRQRIEHLTVFKLDADDYSAEARRDTELDEDDDESDDDTAELLAELQSIKKERKEEETRKDAEKKSEEEKIRNENLLTGNPLLKYQTQSYKVKRRWDDDVVFKNCAKGEDLNKGQHFINDTIRSEFHKKFMSKYIK